MQFSKTFLLSILALATAAPSDLANKKTETTNPKIKYLDKPELVSEALTYGDKKPTTKVSYLHEMTTRKLTNRNRAMVLTNVPQATNLRSVLLLSLFS